MDLVFRRQAATQRPSFDIIPTSLRDLFGYRAAFRYTTPNSSNIVLGHGWAEQDYSATDIQPTSQGTTYLIAEGGIPRRIKMRSAGYPPKQPAARSWPRIHARCAAAAGRWTH